MHAKMRQKPIRFSDIVNFKSVIIRTLFVSIMIA
jgi:hypothetical protein